MNVIDKYASDKADLGHVGIKAALEIMEKEISENSNHFMIRFVTTERAEQLLGDGKLIRHLVEGTDSSLAKIEEHVVSFVRLLPADILIETLEFYINWHENITRIKLGYISLPDNNGVGYRSVPEEASGNRNRASIDARYDAEKMFSTSFIKNCKVVDSYLSNSRTSATLTARAFEGRAKMASWRDSIYKLVETDETEDLFRCLKRFAWLRYETQVENYFKEMMESGYVYEGETPDIPNVGLFSGKSLPSEETLNLFFNGDADTLVNVDVVPELMQCRDVVFNLPRVCANDLITHIETDDEIVSIRTVTVLKDGAEKQYIKLTLGKAL